MSVLFLRPDKAGDALKTLPVLRALRDSQKNFGPFHILLSKDNFSLFEHEPGFTLHLELPNKDFEIAINLQGDFFPVTSELLQKAKAKKKYSVPGNIDFIPLNLPNQSPVHRDESENIAHLIAQALEVPELVESWKSQSKVPVFSAQDREEAALALAPFLRPCFAICPFGGTAKNRIHHPSWKEFLQTLPTENRHWILFAPKSLKTTALDLLPLKKGFSVLYPSSFRALGCYLEKMHGIVAVDSGPLHLAQTLKVPALGFLSGGDTRRWYGVRHPQDHLEQKGWFRSFPYPWQMQRVFKKWFKNLERPAYA